MLYNTLVPALSLPTIENPLVMYDMSAYTGLDSRKASLKALATDLLDVGSIPKRARYHHEANAAPFEGHSIEHTDGFVLPYVQLHYVDTGDLPAGMGSLFTMRRYEIPYDGAGQEAMLNSKVAVGSNVFTLDRYNIGTTQHMINDMRRSLGLRPMQVIETQSHFVPANHATGFINGIAFGIRGKRAKEAPHYYWSHEVTSATAKDDNLAGKRTNVRTTTLGRLS